MPNPGFLLALAQIQVACGDPAENLDRARLAVQQAAGQGARVVVLPEACDYGWTQPEGTEAAGLEDSTFLKGLRQEAIGSGVYICSGLTERAGERIYNTAVLVNPSGDIIHHHRKINELTIGHELYSPGDRLGVAETELGTFGVLICADAFARDHCLLRALGYMGAQVILSPSAWAVPECHTEDQPYGRIWHDSYQPIAKDFDLYIAGVSGVGDVARGAWAGYRCIGSSLLYGPGGELLMHGPYEEVWIGLVDIQPRPRPTWGCGWAESWEQGYPG